MKKTSLLSLALIFLMSSCATFHITVMDESGKVLKEHDTKKVYVGTDAFVPDAIIDPFVMIGSLFYPVPVVKSSIGVGGGMRLNSYITKMASLAPVTLIGNGAGSSSWVIFHDDKGQIQSYNGFNYSISRNAKVEMPNQK
jgi:hypothetical protein